MFNNALRCSGICFCFWNNIIKNKDVLKTNFKKAINVWVAYSIFLQKGEIVHGSENYVCCIHQLYCLILKIYFNMKYLVVWTAITWCMKSDFTKFNRNFLSFVFIAVFTVSLNHGENVVVMILETFCWSYL